MGVRHRFIYVFCLLSLSYLDKFDSSIRCSTHHTSDTNFNPIRTMPVPSQRSNIYPLWRDAVKKGEIWHETSSFANFWILYSSALCLSNKTTKLYTTTKPHVTINPQTSYYKGSAKKKGKQWTSGKLLTVHIIIISSSPSTSCFKQAYHHTTPKLHTTISHLLNRKLLDEVEEVSLLAQSNNIKYKLVTSVLMSLIEAPFWMVRRIHYIANHCKNNSWHLLSPLWLFVVSIFGYLGSCIESSAVHSMKWWC